VVIEALKAFHHRGRAAGAPGEPCAKLVPIARSRTRKPGLMKGRVTGAFFEPLAEDELEVWDQ